MTNYRFTDSEMANSSALVWLGYNSYDNLLYVMYKGSVNVPNRIYVYEDVDRATWSGILAANSNDDVSTMGHLQDLYSTSVLGRGVRLDDGDDVIYAPYPYAPTQQPEEDLSPVDGGLDDSVEVVEENYSLSLGSLKADEEDLAEAALADEEDEAYALNLATLGDGDPVRTATEDLDEYEPENTEEAAVTDGPYSDLMRFEFEVTFQDEDSPSEAAYGSASVNVLAEDEVYAIEYVETLFNAGYVNITSVKRYL